MQKQSKTKSPWLIAYQVLFAVGVIALFVHLGQDAMHASQCDGDYYMAHHLPSNDVTVTVDGQVVSDRYVPIEPDARYLQLQAEANARFAANGCNETDAKNFLSTH